MPYIYLPDNTPSRNYGRNTSSSTFGGSFSNAGSDPRERGRTRSRREIEASSRAEYLAKQEHLAKLREMKAKRDEEEAGKKTSAARTKVLARDDVQGAMQSQAAHQAAQAAAKNKPLERLTPEQSLAKGQAEKQQREAVAAGPQSSTFHDSPQYKANEALMYRLGYIPEGDGSRGRRDDFLPSYEMQLVEKLRDAAMTPSSMFADSLNTGITKKDHMSYLANKAASVHRGDAQRKAQREAGRQQASAPAAPVAPAKPESSTFGPPAPAPHPSTVMRVFTGSGLTPQTERNPNRLNHFVNDSPEQRRNIEQELMNPSGRARPVAKPAQPVQGLLAQSAAEQNMDPKDREFVQGQRRAYQGAALPYTVPTGLANYYGGEGGRILMSDTLGALEGVPGAISNMFGEYTPGPGGQKMLDQAAEYLEPRVSPTIDAGVQYAKDRIAEVGPGAQRMADRAADYLEPRVDAGVQYAKDRIAEVGPGAQRMADQAAEFLEPRVSPTIDAATRYGQQKFSDAMTAVNRPLAEGGLRFDPGVRMPPQREVGGATGGSIGAPTKKREGVNPASFDEWLERLLPDAMKDPRSMYYFPGKYY